MSQLSSPEKSIDKIVQKNSSTDFWIVFDVRLADHEARSGIARFITALTKASCQELRKRQELKDPLVQHIRMLLVSHKSPERWVEDLVYENPHLVSSWHDQRSRIFFKKRNGPVWLWPSLTFRKIMRLTNQNAIWLSFANFDRPLFVCGKSKHQKVIQFIHDIIPAMNFPGIGMFYKFQFRFFVSRNLRKLPNILTVSNFSARALEQMVPQRSLPISVIPDGIDEVFGKFQKSFDKNYLIPKRKDYLKRVLGLEEQQWTENHWIIGVGRSQRYKNWQTIYQVLEQVNIDKARKQAWFLRIGAEQQECDYLIQKHDAQWQNNVLISYTSGVVIFPYINDEELSELYSLGDLLVHPSFAEGFGMPPLEAALSGLPVLFQKGTAIEEHFAPDQLPSQFWFAVDADRSAIWTNQIRVFLDDPKSSLFYQEISRATSPRKAVLGYSKLQNDFTWHTSASKLLDFVLSTEGFISGAKQEG